MVEPRSARERERMEALRPLKMYLRRRGHRPSWLAAELRQRGMEITYKQLMHAFDGRRPVPDGFLAEAADVLGVPVELFQVWASAAADARAKAS